MDTEALVARRGGAHRASSTQAGEELAGALMELYGEGLERIMAAVDDGATRCARWPRTAWWRACC